MIAGHFGLATGVKGRATDVPLWSLMLATVWLDVVFVPHVAAGVESISPVPDAAAREPRPGTSGDDAPIPVALRRGRGHR